MSALTRTLSGVLRSLQSVRWQGAAWPSIAVLLFVWASIAWTPALLASFGLDWSAVLRAEIGVPETSLSARAGVGPDGAQKTPTIVIVFQAADCSSAREDLRAWNGRDVQVLGLVVGAAPDGPRGLDLVIGDAGLTFPVSHRRDGWLEGTLRSIGYERTPILIAIDEMGRLREAGPLAHYSDEQAAQDLLARLISNEATDT